MILNCSHITKDTPSPITFYIKVVKLRNQNLFLLSLPSFYLLHALLLQKLVSCLQQVV